MVVVSVLWAWFMIEASIIVQVVVPSPANLFVEFTELFTKVAIVF